MEGFRTMQGFRTDSNIPELAVGLLEKDTARMLRDVECFYLRALKSFVT